MKNFAALACGILFGLGLAISGMTDTQKVIGFLDLFGHWVPDLIFVMGGAVTITAAGFYLTMKRQAPIFDTDFHLPTTQGIDQNLIVGSTLFGIGWGLYGYCPGPVIASVAYLSINPVIFIVAMAAGMFTGNILGKASKYNEKRR